jgi:hypothetical protein
MKYDIGDRVIKNFGKKKLLKKQDYRVTREPYKKWNNEQEEEDE